MLPYNWVPTSTPMASNDQNVIRLVVRYSGKKFLIVVPNEATFKHVKEEVVRVYKGINPMAVTTTECIAELCDGSGCVLFDDYKVKVLLCDMGRVYAFKQGEVNYISRASTPMPFSTPMSSQPLQPNAVSAPTLPQLSPVSHAITRQRNSTQAVSLQTTNAAFLQHNEGHRLTIPSTSGAFSAIPRSTESRTKDPIVNNASLVSGYVGRHANSGFDDLQNELSFDCDSNLYGGNCSGTVEPGRLNFSSTDPSVSSQTHSGFMLRQGAEADRDNTCTESSRVKATKKRKRRSNSARVRTPKKKLAKPPPENTLNLSRSICFPGFSSDWSSAEDDLEPPKKKTKINSSEKPASSKKSVSPKSSGKSKTTPENVATRTNFAEALTVSRESCQEPDNQESSRVQNGDSGFVSTVRDESTADRHSPDPTIEDDPVINESTASPHMDEPVDNPLEPQTTEINNPLTTSEEPINQIKTENVTSPDPPSEMPHSKDTVIELEGSTVLAFDSVPQFYHYEDGQSVSDEGSVMTRVEETQDILSEIPTTKYSHLRSASPVIPIQGTVSTDASPLENSAAPMSSTTGGGTVQSIDVESSNNQCSVEASGSRVTDSLPSEQDLSSKATPLPNFRQTDYSTDMSTSTDFGGCKKSKRKQKALERIKASKQYQSADDMPMTSPLSLIGGRPQSQMRQYKLSTSPGTKLRRKKVKPVIPKSPRIRRGKYESEKNTGVETSSVTEMTDQQLDSAVRRNEDDCESVIPKDELESEQSTRDPSPIPSNHKSQNVTTNTLDTNSPPTMQATTDHHSSTNTIKIDGTTLSNSPDSASETETPIVEKEPVVSNSSTRLNDHSSSSLSSDSDTCSRLRKHKVSVKSGGKKHTSDSDSQSGKSNSQSKHNYSTATEKTPVETNKKSNDSDSSTDLESSDTEVDGVQPTKACQPSNKETVSSDTTSSLSSDEESSTKPSDSEPTVTRRVALGRPLSLSRSSRTNFSRIKSSKFLFTSSRSKASQKPKNVMPQKMQTSEGTEQSSGDSSSDSDDDSGGMERRKRVSSLDTLIRDGRSVYHPTFRTENNHKDKHSLSIKTKSFSSLNPLKASRVKTDHSEELRVHKRAPISAREELLDDIPLSQQEAELAKKGSKNLSVLLRNEQLWS